MARCFDCFDDIPASQAEYAVLKRLRDRIHPATDEHEPYLESMAYEPVPVCEGCAGWYGDEALMTREATTS